MLKISFNIYIFLNLTFTKNYLQSSKSLTINIICYFLFYLKIFLYSIKKNNKIKYLLCLLKKKKKINNTNKKKSCCFFITKISKMFFFFFRIYFLLTLTKKIYYFIL